MILKSETKKFCYFQAFIQLSQFSLQAAELLHAVLQEFVPAVLKQQATEIQQIEQAADEYRHELLNRLAREFLPPLERADIIRLADEIDDVTDAIENVIINLHIFNVQKIPGEIAAFGQVVKDCCQAVTAAVKEFENFRKTKALQAKIVEVNRLEEVGDRLYRQCMQKLIQNNKDPFALVIWKEILAGLEACCNACETVADDLTAIALINS
ncbi:MAG: DUF47 domain-containing protein [Dethiobacteraceae bacterium]|jgi:predicted phosphate transport protein (TIGR00153 family)|nr:DUF47 family protein [Bacillota bacterium]